MNPQSIIDCIQNVVFGYPTECALCGVKMSSSKKLHGLPMDRGIAICLDCLYALSRERKHVCKICGEKIKPPLSVCSNCLKNLFYFDAQRSAGPYRGNLQYAIWRMKYYGERWLARPLGALVAWAASEFMPIDFLIPIPLEPASMLERGYNQALDLVLEVSALLQVPVVDVLKREKRSHRQTKLSKRNRWLNLRGTMSVKDRVDFQGKRLLLVDDVSTTGATLDEAARVLKELGADKVNCATVAKTLES